MTSPHPVELITVHDGGLPWDADALANLLSQQNPVELFNIKADRHLSADEQQETAEEYLVQLPHLAADDQGHILRASTSHFWEWYDSKRTSSRATTYERDIEYLQVYEQELERLGTHAAEQGLGGLILPHSTYLSVEDPYLRKTYARTANRIYMVVEQQKSTEPIGSQHLADPASRVMLTALAKTLTSYYQEPSEHFLADIASAYQFSAPPDVKLFDYGCDMDNEDCELWETMFSLARWTCKLQPSEERAAVFAQIKAINRGIRSSDANKP